MLRRLRLSGKLAIALVPLAIPLLVGAGMLVEGAVAEGIEGRETVQLARSYQLLSEVVEAFQAEASGVGDLPALEAATDAALSTLERELGLVRTSRISALLGTTRQQILGYREVAETIDPIIVGQKIEQTQEMLLDVGDAIVALVERPQLARELAAAAALERIDALSAVQRRALMVDLQLAPTPAAPASVIQSADEDIVDALADFRRAASPEFLDIATVEGLYGALETLQTLTAEVVRDPSSFETVSLDRWETLLGNRDSVLTRLVKRFTDLVAVHADAEAGASNRRAVAVAAGTTGAVLLAILGSVLLSRSIVRRVRGVTDRARQVTEEQLPALVEALRDLSDDAELPSIPPIRDRGSDEIGDLARSFASMQGTLEQVAEEQVNILRKGVAEMFVTMARRNRSLIDRQLALLDELEAHEDDPRLLGNLYRLDHLATRMRRNSESLLVLAGSESPKKWRKPLEIDDVIRAAIGEVEDYGRVDVLATETVMLKGAAVADLTHLLSELLENATAFSSPETRVRIAGHFHEGGYLITVSDRGVGLSEVRMAAVNSLLQRPPVIGLALEPTLGLYVVAMLARRHGISVRLVPGAPGVTAQVLVPQRVFDSSAEPTARRRPAAPEARTAPPATDGVAVGNGHTKPPFGETRALVEAKRATPSGAVGTSRGNGSAPRRASVPEPSHHNGTADLPVRRPGSSFMAEESEGGVAPSERPEEIRSALDAYAAGRQRATGADLPIRSPGGSLSDDGRDGDRSTDVSPRGADGVRAAFTAYQTGVDAHRRRSEAGNGQEEES